MAQTASNFLVTNSRAYVSPQPPKPDFAIVYPVTQDEDFCKSDVLVSCKRIPETYFNVASMTSPTNKALNADVAHVHSRIESRHSLNIVEAAKDEGFSEKESDISHKIRLMTLERKTERQNETKGAARKQVLKKMSSIMQPSSVTIILAKQ